MNKNPLYTTALILTVVGALNWGLVGLFNLDLVATLFGEMSTISRVVYSLVGISSIIVLLNPTQKTQPTTPPQEEPEV